MSGAIKNSKTHCTWGHEFTAGNSYIDGRGYRSCRQCRKDKVYRDREANKPPKNIIYKTKTEIALEIAKADYKLSFYIPGGYNTDTYWSVMHALNEIEYVQV